MAFELIDLPAATDDPLAAERDLLAMAAEGRCVAHLWQVPPSLVVPRSYQRFDALERARADFAQRGCPVFLRMSGGGLVPQGPGIVNLSLAYRVRGTVGELSETVYRHLCEILRHALGSLGVQTHWQAVEGSFCDGRFNLAWGPPHDARKIAGTAQYWRRLEAASQTSSAPLNVVLAHAVLLVSADPDEINARANAFEDAIGSGRHYLPGRVVSVRQALAATGGALGEDIDDRVMAALRAHVEAAEAPGASAGCN
ncbi:lipoyl protein ligase domain-containing protein [Paraburkholderia kururiensis]|uniref:Lipoate--protein ligase family protein n=1 Tax=Paraburkholderia kururiensis TaxID=984307 RepID=A0ABZ0WP02_9BURK|nr:lipoate--protein ligase family protein [Paraburkholderia kururiensis]WQD79118.1 lipoate--protein ligase family protein [Paraburkholderia kururiensis]